jgi:ribosomal protein S18 acetylase RimI-like enzyme
MAIRQITETDLVPLAQMHIASWRAGFRGVMSRSVLKYLRVEQRCTMWKQFLADPHRQNLLCQIGDDFAGFVSWGACRDTDADPKTAELFSIYVHPAHWRRGVGTALWRALIPNVVGQYKDIILWTLRDTRGARRFYERLGFIHEDGVQRTQDWHNPPLPEVKYRRPLVGLIDSPGIDRLDDRLAV